MLQCSVIPPGACGVPVVISELLGGSDCGCPFLWVKGNTVGHEYWASETHARPCCFPHVTERNTQIWCPRVLCLCSHQLAFNSYMLGCATSDKCEEPKHCLSSLILCYV